VTGQTIAHYRVGEKLGEGGMGVVYRATDTKLGRDVALKVLPEAFAADAGRMARFAREAQLLASLNHPHIAAIHGLEESAGTRALAMELVEGPTLAERIAAGALSVEEALPIARQMAEALEYAHERGVVHRDLKPANVKLTPDGNVKILDFGLAKAMAGDLSVQDMSHSPTLTIAATQAGVILGTAAYMPPEQAKGKTVDRRADIWSFGCVLYEMLTGKQVFSGETVSDTLAAVIRGEPDWEALPGDTPRGLRRLLQRCLEKDPKRRLRDIGEARIAIEENIANPEADVPGVPTAAAAPQPAWRRALPWAVVGVLAIVALAMAWQLLRSPTPPEAVRTSILPPPGIVLHIQGTQPGPAVVSPDGRMVTFAGRSEDGRILLYVRELDREQARPLEGTEGAIYPFWSPDSRSIGFFGGGKLKRVELAGGPPLTLADANNGKGGAWNAAGDILFTPLHSAPLYRLAASGGEVTQLTTVNPAAGEDSHRHPRFLPDGRRYFYLARLTRPGAEGEAGLYEIRVASLDGGEPRTILQTRAQVEYADDYLFHVRGNTLFAQPFDLRRLEFTGEPVPLAQDVIALGAGAGFSVFSVSPAGRLIYQAGDSFERMELTWRDRQGASLGVLGASAEYQEPSISPDGRRVAVVIVEEDRHAEDVWLLDLERDVRTRFTSDGNQKSSPVWSADGSRLAYSRLGSHNLEEVFIAPLAGTEEARRFSAEGQNFNEWPIQFSRDGRYLLVGRFGGEYAYVTVVALPLRPEAGPPVEIAAEGASVGPARLSPDGRWVAYGSFQGGSWQVYVSAFPGLGRRWQVSRDNGSHPVWSRGGREILFLDGTGRIVSVEVSTSGDTLEILGERRLFGGVTAGSPYRYPDFAVGPDPSRILTAAPHFEQGGRIESLTLLQNWRAALAGPR
jgi:eukaryotic-like serine/threonine-protein kinase